MSVLEVKNPFSGEIVKARFAGDEPTQEEMDSLYKTFENEMNKSEFDLSTASPEEIREYARQRRAMGLDPATGERLSEEELIRTYKEPGVDYSTGVDSMGGFSRFQYGRMDDQEEKANYLRTVVGEEGYRTDALGRLLLTSKGREKLGMEKGKDIAIDEEGLSWNDVKEFAGATALPILGGTGMAIAASGVGWVPGMLLVGLATGAGKLLDEGIEYAEGLQRQSAGEVVRDAAYEGVFGAAGEGLGRIISGLFGRLIKGPGGADAELKKAGARELLAKNFRPTIAGATDESFRPILNRLQAVYEGVFPNAKAAEANLRAISDQIKGLGVVDDAAINNLNKAVKADIDQLYKSADNTLAEVQKTFNRSTEKEIDKIMSALKNDEIIPRDLVDVIQTRKKIFDQDADRLYSLVNKSLKGQQIIPTEGIKMAAKQMQTQTIADVEATKFFNLISGLKSFATVEEVSRIRTGLLEATRTPGLIGDANVGSLGGLKASIDNAFMDAEIGLSTVIRNATGDLGPKVKLPATTETVKLGQFDIGQRANTFGGTTEGFQLNMGVAEAQGALNALRRTNAFYRKGVKRFDNVTVEEIISQARKGQLNTNAIFTKIIQDENPEAFGQLMKALRGVPTTAKFLTGRKEGVGSIADLAEGERILKTRTIGNRSISQALDDVRTLPEMNKTRLDVESAARAAEAEAIELSAIRGTGAEIAEQIRQKLGRKYLEIQKNNSLVVDPKTGLKVVDPVKFAANVRAKGSTINRLFGDVTEPGYKGPKTFSKKELDDLLFVMERGKANISPSVMEDVLNKGPLGQGLKELQAAQAERVALNSDIFVNKIRSTTDPDTLADAIFKDATSIKRAEEVLSDSTMETVRTAAMGKILKQIGATVDEAGEVKLAPNFAEDFQSGRLGPKLQTVINAYGKETLDKMFGKNGHEGLSALAEILIKTSDTAIKGKGGLAAPQIALGFTLGNLLFGGNFFTLLGTGAGFKIMSEALRNPRVLKMMMASRESVKLSQFLKGNFKANDPLAQGFTAFQGILATGTARSIEGTIRQTGEEVAPYVQESIKQAKSQLPDVTTGGAPNLSGILSNIIPPAAASSASRVNPILVPDPTTRATFGGG